MNEDEIVAQIIDEIEAVVASDVDVRTSGGDQDTGPPAVVIDWDTSRMQVNGHTSFGAYITDANGHHTGIEHHVYYRMTADCQLLFNDELERDQHIDTVRDAFVPYEKDATKFHRDTAEWDIMAAAPRSNEQFEADWYVGGVTLRFLFVTRTDETGFDNIDTITQDIEINQSLENVTTDTK